MSGPSARRLLLAICLLAPSCASPPPQAPAASSYRMRRLPPSAKEMLAALFAMSQVPLSVSETCAGVGTEPDDTTIGQYLSGFLAELSDTEARNTLVASASQDKSASGETIWVCRVMIRHAKDEDIWSWGVEFSARASDGTVLADSFRCLGAG